MKKTRIMAIILQACNGSEDCQKLNELYIEFQVWFFHLKSKNKIK